MITKTDKTAIFEMFSGPAVGEVIECDQDEAAVVAQWGVIKATLPSGRHSVTIADVEIYVVRMTPTMGLRGGGHLGEVSIKDIPVTPRAMFEYGLRVIDAAKFVQSVMGQSTSTDALAGWASGLVLNSLKTAVWKRASITAGPELMAEAMEGTRTGLEPVGLAVTQFGSLDVMLSDEDRARLSAVQAPAPAALPAGTRVSVAWSDGNRYPGTIRQYQNGYIEIVWDNQSAAWVLPDRVQPA